MRPPPLRKYGEILLSEDEKTWCVICEPQVRMRMKRAFIKVDSAGAGRILISNTPENCRDLEWFCDRYPMDVDRLEVMLRSARAYDSKALKFSAILAGDNLESFELALPPREYQRVAATMAIESGALLVADDLGVGKTVTGICVLAKGGGGLSLVVCPTHIQRQWKKQIEKFAPQLIPHILKQVAPYDLEPKHGRDGKLPNVLISSYAKLEGWAGALSGVVDKVIYDEIQELRRNKSLKYTAAQTISATASLRLGLSGTPIYNYGVEYYNILSILNPNEMGTSEEFRREWCIGDDADKAKIADPKTFGKYLREQGLMIRRTRKDVALEIPTCSKIIHEIDINRKAMEEIESAASELARVILAQGSKSFDRMRASSEFSNTLRLATGIAKAPEVAAFVEMLLETGEPVVLWGWHHAVYKIWEEKLGVHMPSFYTGQETDAAKERAIKRFLDGTTNLLIMSLRSGAGVDGLQDRCATGVYGELDWSPGAMEQCGARIDRPGQLRPVSLYYPIASEGCDPYMIDVLGIKRDQLEGVRDPDADIIESLEVDPNHIRKLAEIYLSRKGKKDHQ